MIDMTREGILHVMDLAIIQDRSRYFTYLDSLVYTMISDEQKVELETEKQRWRDITEMKGYPEIDFPLDIPSWATFTFHSNFKADNVETTLADYNAMLDADEDGM